jgi:hypothetical protein
VAEAGDSLQVVCSSEKSNSSVRRLHEALWLWPPHQLFPPKFQTKSLRETTLNKSPRALGLRLTPEGLAPFRKDRAFEAAFDAVLPTTATQAQVFQHVEAVVGSVRTTFRRAVGPPLKGSFSFEKQVANGFNACILAYGAYTALETTADSCGISTFFSKYANDRLRRSRVGQTGAGKTYTMLGESGEEEGVLPRAVRLLFEKLEEAKADATFEVRSARRQRHSKRVDLPPIGPGLAARDLRGSAHGPPRQRRVDSKRQSSRLKRQRD